MIKWEAFNDKHCLGHTEFGKVWVRTNKDNKVTGLYTMWGETNKIVPTTEEEERFYSNIIALKSVKGLDDYQAIKTAKEVQGKLNKNIIANFKSQQDKLQTQIDSDFTSIKFFGKSQKVSNINEVQLYGEKLFNIYSAMNFSSTEAKEQVLKDLDTNIDQIDGYAYLKRDINAFKSF